MKHEEAILLIDYYGNLLTEKQLEVLKMHFEDDLSMNEISEFLGISKAAVSDMIKRSLKQLEFYELNINIIKEHENINKLLNDPKFKNSQLAKKISKIIKE